jgi:hypothetical protein
MAVKPQSEAAMQQPAAAEAADPAATAVCLAHPAPEVLLVNLDAQESPEPPVFPETQESPQHSLASPSLHHHASHAQLDHPDLQDPLDHPEMLEPQDSPETQEPMLHPANPDQRVRKSVVVISLSSKS